MILFSTKFGVNHKWKKVLIFRLWILSITLNGIDSRMEEEKLGSEKDAEA